MMHCVQTPADHGQHDIFYSVCQYVCAVRSYIFPQLVQIVEKVTLDSQTLPKI